MFTSKGYSVANLVAITQQGQRVTAVRPVGMVMCGPRIGDYSAWEVLAHRALMLEVGLLMALGLSELRELKVLG